MIAEASVSEDYWKHMQGKVAQLEGMWRDPSRGQRKDEMRKSSRPGS